MKKKLVKNIFAFCTSGGFNSHTGYQKLQLHWLLSLSVVLVSGMLVLHPGVYDTFQISGWEEKGEGNIFGVLPIKDNALSLGSFQDVIVSATSANKAEDDITLPIDSVFLAAWTDLMDSVTHSILPIPAYAQTPNSDAFITTWDTTGEEAHPTLAVASVKFHIDVKPGSQVTVDWGNGQSNTYNASQGVSHDYQNSQPGVSKTNTISITGDLEHFYFYYVEPFKTHDSPQLLMSLDQWGDAKWTDMTNMFRGATNMQYNVTDVPDLSSNPDVKYMFRSVHSFNGDLSNWDVSKMTDLGYMFADTPSFNSDISGWDVSKVTHMPYMFHNSPSFNADISDWDVSSVEYMFYMFAAATSFNADISDWDVSSVVFMYNMFGAATSFNADISGWDVSSMYSMGLMSSIFYDASSFDRNLGPWFIVLEDTVVGHDKTVVTPISSQIEFDANTNNYDITGADANYFTITDGGHLVLNSPSDYNSKSQYDITITANNAGVDKLYLDVAPSISVTITVKQPSDTAVTSIARYNPLTQTTDSSTLSFNVLFSDDVTNVNSEDFELSSSSPTNTMEHTYTSTPSLFIPYDTVKTDTITVSDSDTVSAVSVAVDITHAWIGDLLVELISPDNQVVTLHNYAGGSTDDIVKTYTLEYDDDVSINGDWQLRLYDNYNADSGTLNNWSIAFGDDSASNSITSVTGSGSLYYVTVASPQAGTYNLDIAEDNDIVDASNNSLSSRTPTGDDQSYTVTTPTDTATADNTPPVLTLTGLSTVTMGTGTTYTEDGATCIDNNDGDISSQIGMTGSVNTGTAGTYVITYTCTDAANNPATPITRTVSVADSPPTVTSITRHSPTEQNTSNSTLQFSVLFSETVTGVSQDDFELSSDSPTDVTSQPFTYSSTPSLFVPYNVIKTDTITVTDSGTVTSVSVSVDITHTYIGDLKVELVAPDNTVRILHNHIGGSDDDIVKTYTLEYDDDVSINGNWQLRMYDNYDADEGTLNSWSITLGDGSVANPITAVTGSNNQYYVTVDSSQAGTYNLDIAEDNDIVDASNNSLSSRTPTGDDQSYTVTATADNTPPVLTLTGLSTVTVVMGTTYTEDGATCIDNNDGDISSQIGMTGSVNTGTAGTYVITYTCTDAANNPATPITRTISVVDPSPTVTSITRHSPAEQNTGNSTLQFSVLFSETVTGVGQDDFELSSDSPTDATPQTFTYSSEPSLFVPYDVTKTDTITVTDSATVTSVSVSVDITHTYIGDLKVELVAPDNTAHTLHNHIGGSSDDIVKTYTPDFGSVSINGDWQLRLYDNYDADEGTLNSWSITFGDGSTPNPITAVTGSDNQYYVTVASSQAGTYNLDIAEDNNIVDSSNNSLSSRTPTGDDQSYTVTATADNTPPVLTLTGLSTVTMGVGTTYTEDGATCIDNNDGDISSQIGMTGSVNTGTAGTYTITYTCTDAADNPATPITRTVSVVDSPPTVTSITRHSPAEQNTSNSTLQFSVLFSEAVTGVSQDDFELSSDSPTDATPQTFTYSSEPSLFVPYDVTKTDTITVSDSATVTSVSVSLNITHTYIGDLKVELVAPDNTVRILHNHIGGSDDDIVKTYTLEYDDDVSINGNWQLRMYDNYDADEGTLNSWSITLGDGSVANPITAVTGSDNQYYVTVDSSQAGTYNLDIAEDNDIVDASNNSLSSRTPTGDDQSYTVTATS